MLALANEVVRGGQALRRAHGSAGPLPWPAVADELKGLGLGTADQLREIADLVSTKTPEPGAASEPAKFRSIRGSQPTTREKWQLGSRTLQPRPVLDIWVWLAGVSFDGRRVVAGVTSPAADSRVAEPHSGR